MYKTRASFEQMLHACRERKDRVAKELETCPAGSLKYMLRGKRAGTYVHSFCENGKRRRTSLRKAPDLLAHLAHKEYLQAELEILDRDIQGLEQLLALYEELSVENATARLPSYCFHPPITEKMLLTGEPEPADKASEADFPWSEQPYEQSDYLPEHRCHTTSRGLKVRSKSEVAIAELLYKLGIEFRYEEVLHIGRHRFVPDFTIRKKDGSLLYYEHCGMVTDAKYLQRHRRKMEQYQQAGIVPWENLIVSYDNRSGDLDLKFIELELRHKVLGE